MYGYLYMVNYVVIIALCYTIIIINSNLDSIELRFVLREEAECNETVKADVEK